jgi:phosphatidylethanolamine/phosphatidyl-N-methylethanolamine N-methyltransferase
MRDLHDPQLQSRQRCVDDHDDYDAESAYVRWAPFYDLIFAKWLEPGRRAGAFAASQTEGRILDVGVGTGLELPFFLPNARVVGVDLSEAMLLRASERIRRQRLAHVEGLACMDACRLGFADSSFGCVVLMYILSVAPQPGAILDEAARVVRPGGEIIVVNRVSRDGSALVALEVWIGRRLGSKIGWRPHFPWKVIEDWLSRRTNMRLVERRPIGPLDLSTLARIQRTS